MQWIADNIGNIVIILLLILMVIGIIVKLVKDKRKGRSPCGCNCSHCAMSGACHYKGDSKN
ncbi:MAG: FeoB-associated Cys-rich membrane protein [Clostridiales bacterium]|nr:FeoB-associated Cys-rich membrane protein [Clostridiales bacterium]